MRLMTALPPSPTPLHCPVSTFTDLLLLRRNRLIGQMILVTFDEPTVTKEVRTLIEKYYVGNFKISRRNIQGTQQTTYSQILQPEEDNCYGERNRLFTGAGGWKNMVAQDVWERHCGGANDFV